MDTAPSPQLVLQRIRNRIIEYLELASSFDAQVSYQDAAEVCVSTELINQWEDWYSGEADVLRAPVFTDVERNAIAAFHVTWSDVSGATPDPLPSLKDLQRLPEWNQLRVAAEVALRVFAGRGRLPEDVELAVT